MQHWNKYPVISSDIPFILSNFLGVSDIQWYPVTFFRISKNACVKPHGCLSWKVAGFQGRLSLKDKNTYQVIQAVTFLAGHFSPLERVI